MTRPPSAGGRTPWPPVRSRRRLTGAAAVVLIAGCGGPTAAPPSAAPPSPAPLTSAATPTAATPTAVTPTAVTPTAVTPTAVTPTAVTPTAVTPTVATPTTGCSTAATIAGWSLARRAAQLVVVPSLDFDLVSLRPVIAQGVGGVLFLGSTVPPANLARLVAEANREAPGQVPLLTMADEEGGGIQRLAGLVTSFPWARQIAATMTPDSTRALGRTVAHQMIGAGVDVDLAPVLDVDGGDGPSATNPDGRRSFSADPVLATRFATAFLHGLMDGGVTPVVKHFPGLGGVTGNTDNGPAVTQPIDVLRTGGLLPFRAAISAAAPAVMTSNASTPGLSALPASLSPAVITGLLRDTLGFRGLVLTDSLSAGAISGAGYGVPAAAAASIEAGADMILFGSTLTPAETLLLTPADVATSVARIVRAITSAVASGALPERQLDASVLRILRTKRADPCA